jgi:hypothetical protein
MGIGFPVEGEGWWRIDIGLDGEPQGVSTSKLATSSKFGRCLIPIVFTLEESFVVVIGMPYRCLRLHRSIPGLELLERCKERRMGECIKPSYEFATIMSRLCKNFCVVELDD